MLNACRHHGGHHSPPGSARASWRTSAQRLSASRRASLLDRPVGPAVALDVLNACRHHGGHHLDSQDRGPTRCDVLNACRHHGGHHLQLPVDFLSKLGCSTPVGITAGITTLKALEARGLIKPCSTPVGITAGITAGRVETRPLVQVLNACRHHGGHHEGTDEQKATALGVLNACRHHGGHHRSTLQSKRGTRTVLNACRHHGGHHVTSSLRRC